MRAHIDLTGGERPSSAAQEPWPPRRVEVRGYPGNSVSGRSKAAGAAMIGLAGAGLLACAEKPSPIRQITGADPKRGLAVIEQEACGVCHDIPGVAWPKGQVGGSLAGFADRALIAGRFPNRPEVLTRWLRDPPALSPATAMPATGLNEAQARDVAAYLYTLDDR